jgi:hypothetical protein
MSEMLNDTRLQLLMTGYNDTVLLVVLTLVLIGLGLSFIQKNQISFLVLLIATPMVIFISIKTDPVCLSKAPFMKTQAIDFSKYLHKFPVYDLKSKKFVKVDYSDYKIVKCSLEDLDTIKSKTSLIKKIKGHY